MKKLIALAAALALAVPVLAGLPAAWAGTDQKTFDVSAEVVPSCLFTASANIAFGQLDVHLGTKNADGSLTVKCTPETVAKIGLDPGLNGADGQRKISNGAQSIAYDLYQNAARDVAWKNADPDRKGFIGDGTEQVHQVYGTLLYSSYVPIGSYNDTVTATVEF
jgi:spore coat protein U-like protein